MKKEILKKGIILPLIIGIVLSIAFFLFLSNADVFNPISDGAVLAYHDEIGADSTVDSKDRLTDYSVNDAIGTITSGEDYLVRYNADYANMISSLSYIDGAKFGSGITYLSANSTIASKLADVKFCTYDGPYGRHSYQYRETKKYKGEYSAISDDLDYSNALVVIYQARDKYGISSQYSAMIFEEVR